MLTRSESNIIERLKAGGEEALNEYFANNRAQLRKFVDRQIQPKLGARVDGSDIMQDAFIRATQQFEKYIRDPKISAFNWLKRVCQQALMRTFEQHIETAKRSITQEQAPFAEDELEGDVVAQFHPRIHASTPSSIVRREELREQVLVAIGEMSEADRTIIAKVHSEDRTLVEAAEELGINYEAAKKRYRRAMRRLGVLLTQAGAIDG